MINLSVSDFRAGFPAFGDTSKYPDAVIESNFTSATTYISDSDYGRIDTKSRTNAIYLMTAHLLSLADTIASGQMPALVSGSTIDKISVTLTPPPVKGQFQWWLSLTAYGQQLLAMLLCRSAGGFFVGGGSYERGSFRKAGGNF